MKPKFFEHLNGVGTVSAISALVGWSAVPVFMRYLANYQDFWTQNFYRYTVTVLFWLPYLVHHWRQGRVPKGLWRSTLFLSAVNIISQTVWAESVYYIEPAFMSMIHRLSVIWNVAFSMWMFADERALLRSGRFYGGMILSVAGLIGVIVFKEGFTARATMIGILLTMAAGITAAIYMVAARKAFAQVDSRIGFSYVAIYTTVGLAVLAFLFGHPGTEWRIPAKAWGILILSSIIGIALCHVLFFIAMKRIGATIPSVLLQASPFLVLVGSYFAFGETMNGMQLISGVVLLLGAGLALLAQRDLRDEPS